MCKACLPRYHTTLAVCSWSWSCPCPFKATSSTLEPWLSPLGHGHELETHTLLGQSQYNDVCSHHGAVRVCCRGVAAVIFAIAVAITMETTDLMPLPGARVTEYLSLSCLPLLIVIVIDK